MRIKKMQSNSSRGIQQEDVRLAADALIAEGLRPTIERVRQKIGRGSPNTVSPMLDNWFAGLAERLGVVNTNQHTSRPPEPVQAAAAALWEAALQSAHHVAEQNFLQATEALSAKSFQIEERETELVAQRQTFTARQIALDEALQLAREQIASLGIRLEEMNFLQRHREAEIKELGKKLKIREDERDAELQRRNDESARHAEERLKLEARATTNERRLLTDLDRERQEVKRGVLVNVEMERRAKAVQFQLESKQTSLMEELNQAEQLLNRERDALSLANERILEFKELLLVRAEPLITKSKRKPFRPIGRAGQGKRKL